MKCSIRVCITVPGCSRLIREKRKLFLSNVRTHVKVTAAAWKKQNVKETSAQNTLFGGETDDFG